MVAGLLSTTTTFWRVLWPSNFALEQERNMADHAAAYAHAVDPAEDNPLAPLRRKLYLMSMNSFLMRLHRDCPKITKLLETWAGQSQFYENIHRPRGIR